MTAVAIYLCLQNVTAGWEETGKKKKESSSAVLRLNETALPENLQGNRKNRSMNQNNY